MNEAELRRALVDLQSGRVATVGQFDLDIAPAVSTTVIARLCSEVSVVIPVAKTIGAAYEMTLAEFYIEPSKGYFTVYHSASGADRVFRFALFTNIFRI